MPTQEELYRQLATSNPPVRSNKEGIGSEVIEQDEESNITDEEAGLKLDEITTNLYKEYENLPFIQQLGLAVAPGTGEAISAYETPKYAKETKEAFKEGDYGEAALKAGITGLSALGAVPLLGMPVRAAKGALKTGIKLVDESKDIFEALSDRLGKKITKKDTDNFKKDLKEQGEKGFKDIPNEKLEESIREVTEGKKTVEAHKETVELLKPIQTWTKEIFPKLVKTEDIPFILRPNKLYSAKGVPIKESGVYQLNKNISDGEIIETRLDIDAYEDFNKWIAALKRPKSKGMIYSPTAVLQDVTFKPGSKQAARVGRGDKYTRGDLEGKKITKTPFGTIRGNWLNHNSEKIYQQAYKLLDDPSYVQIGYDPRRHGVFYTRQNFAVGNQNIPKQTPIEAAEEVIQVGPLVLAKNPKFGKTQNYEKGGYINYIKERI